MTEFNIKMYNVDQDGNEHKDLDIQSDNLDEVLAKLNDYMTGEPKEEEPQPQETVEEVEPRVNVFHIVSNSLENAVKGFNSWLAQPENQDVKIISTQFENNSSHNVDFYATFEHVNH